MTKLRIFVTIVALSLSCPIDARADVVVDWNEIALATLASARQSPFAQARYMSITQLAVFEAVNAIAGDYEPYLGTVVAPAGASADAAAVTAAYRVLKNYFPNAANLDPAYAASLAAIPDGLAKTDGIATGESAAAQMIARRVGDGASPSASYLPTSSDPGEWQTTPSCSRQRWYQFSLAERHPVRNLEHPGSQDWIGQFLPGPPPALTSTAYTKDYNEVRMVGGIDSTARPPDRADVARFYATTAPGVVFNMVARQVAFSQGGSLSQNARALALVNMASNDAFIVSFATKYFYTLWRPETAIRVGDVDGNEKTDPDPGFLPFITAPCFPAYPSNHASGSNSAAEILRRIYGAGGHSITVDNPDLPGVSLYYTTFKQITDDVDDARVYGGIHFRFDQDAGGRLGRDIATFIYKNNLRAMNELEWSK